MQSWNQKVSDYFPDQSIGILILEAFIPEISYGFLAPQRFKLAFTTSKFTNPENPESATPF